MRLDCSVSSLGLLIKLMKGEKLVEGLLFSSCMVGGEKWIQECECVFNGLAQFKLVVRYRNLDTWIYLGRLYPPRFYLPG